MVRHSDTGKLQVDGVNQSEAAKTLQAVKAFHK